MAQELGQRCHGCQTQTDGVGLCSEMAGTALGTIAGVIAGTAEVCRGREPSEVCWAARRDRSPRAMSIKRGKMPTGVAIPRTTLRYSMAVYSEMSLPTQWGANLNQNYRGL